jgi:hypothetical protein
MAAVATVAAAVLQGRASVWVAVAEWEEAAAGVVEEAAEATAAATAEEAGAAVVRTPRTPRAIFPS